MKVENGRLLKTLEKDNKIAIAGTTRPYNAEGSPEAPIYSAPSTRKNDNEIWGGFSRNLEVTLLNTTITLSPFSGIIGGVEIVSETALDLPIAVPTENQDIYVFLSTDESTKDSIIDIAQISAGSSILWESDYNTIREEPIFHILNVPTGTTDLSAFEPKFDITIGGVGGGGTSGEWQKTSIGTTSNSMDILISESPFVVNLNPVEDYEFLSVEGNLGGIDVNSGLLIGNASSILNLNGVTGTWFSALETAYTTGLVGRVSPNALTISDMQYVQHETDGNFLDSSKNFQLTVYGWKKVEV